MALSIALRERAAREVYAILHCVTDPAEEVHFLDKAMAGGGRYVESPDEARRIVDAVAAIILPAHHPAANAKGTAW